MNNKENRPLNLFQCWDLVNSCDTQEKIRAADEQLGRAVITYSQYVELMEALSFISRELYRQH